MKNKSIFKDAFSLLCITLVAGFCLGMVYQITKEPIKEAKWKAKQEAYKQVFSNAENFVENEFMKAESQDGTKTVVVDGAAIDDTLEAQDENGNFLGYVISVTSSNGYGGDITLAVGITKDRDITGVKVVTMNETPGLGAKCTEVDFISQFSGINANRVEFTKAGKTKDNEIDAISGATITTNAVTEGVNGVLAWFEKLSAKRA